MPTSSIETPVAPKLTIELVPRTCWYINVRSEVSRDTWDFLREEVYELAQHQCEICGGKGRRWPVECHEVWDFNDKTKVQTLVRMIALCPSCHEVKHMGFAESRGRLKIALRHLAKVNQWTFQDAETYAEAQFELWAQRSHYDWELDISGLDKYRATHQAPLTVNSECYDKWKKG